MFCTPSTLQPCCLSFTHLDNVQPDFLWWLLHRNGSSAKLCTVGISTFLLSHKITDCCSILCYGRCMPMGWLVEQRRGESRPACSSKQVLCIFEDAQLLQANVGLVSRACVLFDTHSKQSDNQDLWPVGSDILLPGGMQGQKQKSLKENR